MIYIVPFVCLLITTLLDESLASFCFGFAAYIGGIIFALSCSGIEKRRQALNVFAIVYSLYIISSYIFSLSFHDGEFYLVSDPMRYIERFDLYEWSWKDTLEELESCYLNFADNNALYNESMKWCGYISNTKLGGITPMSLTLIQTTFGLFTSIIIYKLLCLFFTPYKANRYALFFSIFTYVHIYSCFILRDIIITFFFTCGIYIVLKKESKFVHLACLIIIFLIICGIRIYTGLFFGVFIAYWFFVYFKNSRARSISYFALLIGGALIISSFFSSSLFSQTMEESQVYSEFSSERGGITSSLRALPAGISHFTLLLFSQFGSFAPFSNFDKIKTFSQLYIEIWNIIDLFCWYIVSYGLLIALVVKKGYKFLTTEEKLLLGISVLFICLNTAHLDYRRMMGVYPIIFLIYLKVISRFKIREKKTINILLFSFYIFTIATYAII